MVEKGISPSGARNMASRIGLRPDGSQADFVGSAEPIKGLLSEISTKFIRFAASAGVDETTSDRIFTLLIELDAIYTDLGFSESQIQDGKEELAAAKTNLVTFGIPETLAAMPVYALLCSHHVAANSYLFDRVFEIHKSLYEAIEEVMLIEVAISERRRAIYKELKLQDSYLTNVMEVTSSTCEDMRGVERRAEQLSTRERSQFLEELRGLDAMERLLSNFMSGSIGVDSKLQVSADKLSSNVIA